MDYENLADEYLEIKSGLRKLNMDFEFEHTLRGSGFVLFYLANHGYFAFPKDLSEGLNTSTARIAGILKRLESRGLIERRTDHADNRKILVALTDDGIAESNRIYAQMRKNIETVFEFLGPEDSLEYVRITRKLLDSLVSSDTNVRR